MKELFHDENSCRRDLLMKPFEFTPQAHEETHVL